MNLDLLKKRARITEIPAGWKLVNVGSCCAIRNELRTPIAADVRALSKGPYPYYGPTGILDWISEFRYSGQFALIGEDGDHFLKHVEKDQTLLVEGEFSVNNHAHVIADSEQCYAEWFAWYFRHRSLRDILTRQGAGRYKLTKEALQSLPILLPPLVEQRRITEVLRAWDKSIKNTGRLIAAKERRLSWLRAEVLTGKRRLPGHEVEWKSSRLGDILIEHGHKSGGNEEVFSVSVHKGLINQIEHLGRSFAAKVTGHYNLVQPGDIVYTKSPTGEFPFGIIKRSKIDKQVIVSPLYGVFTPIDPDVGVILDAFFEAPVNTKNYLAPLVQKGAKNTIAITNKRFLEGRISVPTDTAEQADLANIVTTARSEIDALHKRVDLLDRQKSGLMQKLLTGEWRLSVRSDETGGTTAQVIAEAAQ